MKVMCYPEEKGLGGGVATTGKRACETPIHNWRGRLATPLPTPTFMLRCEIHFMGVSSMSITNSFLPTISR